MFGLFKSTPSISTKELANKLGEKPVIIDVRTKQEYQGGHIGIAKNVPLDKIGNYKHKQEGEIYVICQSGMRSKKAAGVLKKKDYDVINVRGGMSQWSGPVRRGV